MRGRVSNQSTEEQRKEAAERVEVRQAAPEQRRQGHGKYREQKQDLVIRIQQAALPTNTREAVKQ